MKKIIAVSILISSFSLNSALAFDMGILKPVNPLDNNPATYQEVINQPSFELKRGTLTRNAIKNQYTIAMDKLCKVMSAHLIRILKFLLIMLFQMIIYICV